MKNRIIVLVCLLLIISFGIGISKAGVFENTVAKSYGGKITKNLLPNKKLVNVTWKMDSLWFLTRDMRKDEFPEIYSFKEDSTFGLVQGEVIIVESKK